jgi:hypothetical protein
MPPAIATIANTKSFKSLEAAHFSINQIAKGVFPVPPIFKLPITMEGTTAFFELKIPTENKK